MAASPLSRALPARNRALLLVISEPCRRSMPTGILTVAALPRMDWKRRRSLKRRRDRDRRPRMPHDGRNPPPGIVPARDRGAGTRQAPDGSAVLTTTEGRPDIADAPCATVSPRL